MEFTIDQIAQILNGEVEGDGFQKVSRLDKIQDGLPGGVSFLSNLKYEPYLYQTKSTAVIVSKNFIPTKSYSTTLIKVKDAYTAFTQLLEVVENFGKQLLIGTEEPSFMDESSTMETGGYRGAFSYIGKNCKIGKNVKIYPHVYIGDSVVVGDNCILYSGVKIMRQTQIGNYCEFHPGVVIGGDGFGFAPQEDGSYKNIPQLGNVIIEDYVSIGVNSTIDCATIGSTRIGRGVKIDNLVQIAHNVTIGENTVIASQAGVAGSTVVGKNCVLGGRTALVGHIKIADNTTVAGNTGMMKSVENSGLTFFGYIGMDIKDFLKSYAVFKKLPQLQNKLKDLEKKQ